jgi:hypothetical protein
VFATVGLTVVLSVVAHGASAGPLARRYSAWCEDHPPTALGTGHEIPSRSRLHRVAALGSGRGDPR